MYCDIRTGKYRKKLRRGDYMPEKKYLRNVSILALSVSLLALSACSTSSSARYGSEKNAKSAISCGAVAAPCIPAPQYHPLPVQEPAYHVVQEFAHTVTVQQPEYLVPAPCPVEQCPPPIAEPVYEPPVVVEPVYEPPVFVEPPYVPPVISCPEGTIPSYGGQDCIQIAIPRK